MTASAPPLHQIKQASELSGISAKMIRYYERVGLVRPAGRSSGNYRTYDHAALDALLFVARAREFGFSTDEIAGLLTLWQAPARSSAAVKALALRHVAALDNRIQGLRTMRDTLERLARECPGDARPDCPILDRLSGRGEDKTRARGRRKTGASG